MATANIDNVAAPDTSFFTPRHKDSPGAAIGLSDKTPTLFKPLKIRDATLRNRILVAPMCQYSTAPSGPEIGKLTPYHIATLGHYALKGSSLVFIEATGVQPNGRISPNCPGLWSDDQVDGVRKVAEFVKSQGALCGIQLAHAGRKSSTIAPWLSTCQRQASNKAPKEVGGWPDNVVGPMGGVSEVWDGKAASESGYYPPRPLSTDEVRQISKDFAAAARRSVEAGIDVIEVHGAHGYLIHQFLSPITNRRTDEYGGSFENRTRLLFETLKAVRDAIPTGMPLFLRLSSTEWMEESDLAKKYGSWDVESTIKVATQLPALGVDLLDVSSGGNHPKQRINMFLSKDYQTRIAARIRKELHAEDLSLLIGAVGLITEAKQAQAIVEETSAPAVQVGHGAVVPAQEEASIADEAKAAVKMTEGQDPAADVILVARQFMREPEWVLKVAWQLGVEVAWPSQFSRVRFPKL